MGKGSSALGKRDTGRSRKLPFQDGCPHFDLEGAGAAKSYAALTLCPRNNQGLSQLDPNRPPRRDPRLLPPSLLAATPGRRATGTPLPKFNTPFTLWRLSLRFLFRKRRQNERPICPKCGAMMRLVWIAANIRIVIDTHSSTPPAKPILISY